MFRNVFSGTVRRLTCSVSEYHDWQMAMASSQPVWKVEWHVRCEGSSKRGNATVGTHALLPSDSILWAYSPIPRAKKLKKLFWRYVFNQINWKNGPFENELCFFHCYVSLLHAYATPIQFNWHHRGSGHWRCWRRSGEGCHSFFEARNIKKSIEFKACHPLSTHFNEYN